MDRKEEHNINMEEIEEDMEDQIEEQADIQKDTQEDIEDYGYPQADPVYNQHAIISKSIDNSETLKTTFLSSQELGRPLFSVRFMLDLQKIAEHQDLPRIAKYFEDKIRNITHSGMSNEGFVMNLAVTQKRDTTRKKSSYRDTSGLKNQKEVKKQSSYGY